MKILLRADLFDCLAVLRAEVRVRMAQAADVATECVGLDGTFQAATDPLEREQAANALRYSAAAAYLAEQRAVEAVFLLRCAEHEIEAAHARLLTLQREDEGRARMLDKAMGGKPLP